MESIFDVEVDVVVLLGRDGVEGFVYVLEGEWFILELCENCPALITGFLHSLKELFSKHLSIFPCHHELVYLLITIH